MYVDTGVLQRDVEGIRKYIGQAEEEADEFEHKLYQAIISRAYGVVHHLEGDLEKAGEKLIQALELFKDLDTRWQIGRTFYELGTLEQERDHTGLAKEYFTKSLAAFDEIGAVPDINRTRSALDSLK